MDSFDLFCSVDDAAAPASSSNTASTTPSALLSANDYFDMAVGDFHVVPGAAQQQQHGGELGLKDALAFALEGSGADAFLFDLEAAQQQQQASPLDEEEMAYQSSDDAASTSSSNSDWPAVSSPEGSTASSDYTPSTSKKAASTSPAGKKRGARALPKHPQAPTTQMTQQLNKMLRLNLSEEELVEMDLDEIQELSGVHFTKLEERQIRQLRRKLKNKMAAASSREKKRNYLGDLEERFEVVTLENAELRETVERLRRENEALRAQLQLQQHHADAELPRKMPRLTPTFAAPAPAATSRPVRVTKSTAVSAFVVLLMLFGAVANHEILPGFGASGGNALAGKDEQMHMNAGGILSGPLAFWAGASGSGDASPAFSTGRRLLVSVDRSGCANSADLDDDVDADLSAFVTCDGLLRDTDDEALASNNATPASWTESAKAAVQPLWERLLAAVALHNETLPGAPAEAVLASLSSYLGKQNGSMD